jgi:hypothetical protein
MARWVTLFSILLLLGGCVEQTLTVKTDPPGALVYMNDQEVGRTPFTRDFTWYGNYDVEVRKEGFETIKTTKWIKAPAYLWVPFDLFSALMPFPVKDHHDLFYELHARSSEPVDAPSVISRAEDLKDQLDSSKYTRAPGTQPATKRTTKATTTPTTNPATRPMK